MSRACFGMPERESLSLDVPTRPALGSLFISLTERRDWAGNTKAVHGNASGKERGNKRERRSVAGRSLASAGLAVRSRLYPPLPGPEFAHRARQGRRPPPSVVGVEGETGRAWWYGIRRREESAHWLAQRALRGACS